MGVSNIILGIDPGTNILGYALIKCTGANKIELLTISVLRMDKIDNHPEKLKQIYTTISSIIQTHKPNVMSIEAPFFGKNVQSMLKLGRAQGVAIAAAINSGIQIQEYSPKKIKQSITGNGNASKEQVSAMLQQLLNFNYTEKYLDATDALAAAVCYHFQQNTFSEKKASSWKSFVDKNPHRKL